MTIVKKSLSDQIYEVLKKDILDGRIAFGEVLVNKDLQARFEVRSTPIRDAILRLYSDGLIESIERTGSRVIDFNLSFALDVNEILMFIVLSGMTSAYRKDDHVLIAKKLNEIVKKQKENIGTDEYFYYDYLYHKTFVQHSKNSRLIKLFKEYNVLHEILVRSFYTPDDEVTSEKNSIAMHQKILDAFGKGDLDLALKFNEEHYGIAEKLFKENL